MLGDLAQCLVPLEVVDVPEHCVLGGLSGEALEVFRWECSPNLTAIGLQNPAGHVQCTCHGVELHSHDSRGVECAHVGHRERLLDRMQHLVERNPNLGAERVERFCEALGGRFRD